MIRPPAPPQPRVIGDRLDVESRLLDRLEISADGPGPALLLEEGLDPRYSPKPAKSRMVVGRGLNVSVSWPIWMSASRIADLLVSVICLDKWLRDFAL